MAGAGRRLEVIEVKTLYQDNHLWVVNKPAGMPTVPDDSRDPSVFDWVGDAIREDKQKPGNVFVGVVQRLDRPVGGVLVFARTSKAAARLNRQFHSHEIGRRYVAVTEGIPEAEGRIEHSLLKEGRRNVVRVVPEGTPRSKAARTQYRVLSTWNEHALVELVPDTGRSHQLRVAMASLGTPLVGDLKYGASDRLPDRSVALFAEHLELMHPTRKERVRFEARPPRVHAWRAFDDVLGT